MTRALAVEAPALYPEGIEHNPATGGFLLGSIRKGKVLAVSPDGKVRTLVEDERLRSVVGIRVDAVRGRLIVTNSDYGVAERSIEADKFAIAAVGIYDLASGKPVHYVDLSGLRPGERRFVNDVAVDEDGNTYVTDSLPAAIYKVTPEGQASVFVAHERFRGQGFNLNGIQVHPDGFLLVAKKSDGALFKIPLAQPDGFSEVRLPEPLVGTDGLVLASAGELVAIANVAGNAAPNTIYRLASDDGWASARIDGEVATGDVYATTGIIKAGKLYVSNGWLHTLPATLKDRTQPRGTFRIVEVGVM
ncbi:MAG: hypothetical protein HC774_03535 [Sphingomonadales bacterium]|nr:hypothetical protein [Sphingomonadales bacterium]